MKQVIEWEEIEWDGYTNVNVPHAEPCFFLNKDKEILTGHYRNHDGKWVLIDPIIELTFRVPLLEFTHYAEVV